MVLIRARWATRPLVLTSMAVNILELLVLMFAPRP